ncbi:sensor histidine kinase [Calothrix sp. FACHB-1219]|uniref:sensor histidine kinase n=1 Tax=unclassified Calothrix TaxID=2619626 RepID=UPI00168206EF|nr:MULTISPECIES: sensor histidine kinase [unclassified Calothrix]MBD2204528.1 sensor histidine kinase [Calothrix sp. FACHB-168]MBD2219326.1 sensor histidine kinase [Calothrix sp. FACHB-1219]
MVEELYTPEQLNHMHQQLWQCVLEFANLSATQERNRIARELHDSLGHALTALNFQLQTASKLCKPDPNQAQEFINEAHRLVAIATQEVRQSVKALRNDPLATQSLESLIESLVRDFHQTTGILPEVEINLPISLLPHLTAQLYRIIQEALNNIRKYAQATAVQIHLCTTSTGLHLTIQDNGRGFEPENISGGYGLQGMQERIAVLQGHFHLESQPQAGCCINIFIPMQTSNIAEIPKIPEISNISIISEISIPPQSIIITQNQSVKIGEWQPLNLDEWHSLESSEYLY